MSDKELIGVLYDVANRLAWKIDVLAAVEFLDTQRIIEHELAILSKIEIQMQEKGIERWRN